MKKIFTLLLVFTSIVSNSQNLFPNQDFEEYEYCPDGYGHIGGCKDWVCIAGSPDYYNCDFYGSTGGEIFGVPHSGSGVLGMWALPNNLWCNGALQRESVSATLITPLEACHTYQVSFNLRIDWVDHLLSEGQIGNECIEFGFYFYNGSNPNQCANSCGCWNVSPQISISANQVSVGSYTHFSASFTATDNFNKVAVGPFCNDILFSDICISDTLNRSEHALYFNLDDIHLIELNPLSVSISDTIVCQNDTVQITASHVDAVDSWSWEILNAEVIQENDSSVVCVFPNTGDFSIAVSATSECGTSYLNVSNAIRVHSSEYPPTVVSTPILMCHNSHYVLSDAGTELKHTWSDGLSGNVRQFSSSGEYYITTSDSYGCYLSLDTLEIRFIDSIFVFPNPTHNIWLSEGLLLHPNQVKLFDEQGKIILHNENVDVIELNAKKMGLSSGVYHLVVQVQSCIRTFKLILIS